MQDARAGTAFPTIQVDDIGPNVATVPLPTGGEAEVSERGIEILSKPIPTAVARPHGRIGWSSRPATGTGHLTGAQPGGRHANGPLRNGGRRSGGGARMVALPTARFRLGKDPPAGPV